MQTFLEILGPLIIITTPRSTRVSAVADRPEQRNGSAHAKYSVSHHMVIKPCLLLGQLQLLSTDLDGWCDQQLSDDHQMFMTFTGKLS